MSTNRAAFLCAVWIYTAIVTPNLLAIVTAAPAPSCETELVPPTDSIGGI